MKKFFLFGASIVILAGCRTNDYYGPDYGYNYDLALPLVSGTATTLNAGLNSPYTGSAYAEQPPTQHPASQSVVFYEGSQPSQGTVAAGTPVWTSPVAGTPAPAYVPGAPVVNEAAGAGVAPGAAVGAAPVGGEAAAPYYYGGDGSLFIGGTNGTPQGGINITNNNIVGFPTNGLTNITGTNRFTTNTTSITNANGGVVTTNVVTSNLLTTNVARQPTNTGIPVAPVAGATNNNQPRANSPAVGNPPGTPLVNQRAFGSPPTPVQSQVATGQLPTQPGPVTTEAAGASTTGTTGTATGTQQPAPQNTTLGPNNVQTSVQASTPQRGQVNSGNPPVTAPTTAPRILTTPRQTQQQAAPRAPGPTQPK